MTEFLRRYSIENAHSHRAIYGEPKHMRLYTRRLMFSVMLGALLFVHSNVHAIKDKANQGRWEKPVENGPDKEVPGFLVNLGPTGAHRLPLRH